MSCNPGPIPRLLGCVDATSGCEDGGWACALLSLAFAILVALVVAGVAYAAFFTLSENGSDPKKRN